jgi:alpha-galactosidase
MIITNEQKQLLLEHMPEAQRSIDHDDIDQLLEDLDVKITEIGFDADYELNGIGLMLQKLYDELYGQN